MYKFSTHKISLGFILKCRQVQPGYLYKTKGVSLDKTYSSVREECSSEELGQAAKPYILFRFIKNDSRIIPFSELGTAHVDILAVEYIPRLSKSGLRAFIQV